MDLHGQHIIGGRATAGSGDRAFSAVNPATGETLAPRFSEAGSAEVERAMALAAEAFETTRTRPGRETARFLLAIAEEIEATGDALIERAGAESGLPRARLEGERARTLGGVRIFAELAREGSWVGARIDRAEPQRKPLPKPDVRSMLTGVGPVIVFGASNFPLAISVAGNDTMSALAAGCPVVVKAHPGHPGTSEIVGSAIARAAARTGTPPGAFALLQGAGHEVGLALVRHPAARAVAFTGSLGGGRALFDAASARVDPILVFAEMGSTNPVVVLPGALAERGAEIAAAYVQSVSLGVGQFCTNPGLVFGLDGDGLGAFVAAAGAAARVVAPATMLHAGIERAFSQGTARTAATPGVSLAGQSADPPAAGKTQASCVLFWASAETFFQNPHLGEEVFGPTSIVVRCPGRRDLETAIRGLGGHLTASVHATPADLAEYRDLIDILATKVGRIVMNGFGTGIEVCPSMHHGGPYPATTQSQFTSIGHAAIFRFARPLCFQNFPDHALPEALRAANPLGLWRLCDGRLTRDGETPGSTA